MRDLLDWLWEKPGWLMLAVGLMIFGITLGLWFSQGAFWPWGYVAGTALVVVGIAKL